MGYSQTSRASSQAKMTFDKAWGLLAKLWAPPPKTLGLQNKYVASSQALGALSLALGALASICGH